MDRLKENDIVVHFKRETVDITSKPSMYMYRIVAFATHTETKEKMVVYQALYDDIGLGVLFGQYYTRPYDMFMSKVDNVKYPDIKQEYRFEKYSD